MSDEPINKVMAEAEPEPPQDSPPGHGAIVPSGNPSAWVEVVGKGTFSNATGQLYESEKEE